MSAERNLHKYRFYLMKNLFLRLCSNCFPLAEITVTFTTPDVSVDEDVGSTDVCFLADTPSARSYEVQLGREASGTNPATRKLQDGMR